MYLNCTLLKLNVCLAVSLLLTFSGCQSFAESETRPLADMPFTGELLAKVKNLSVAVICPSVMDFVGETAEEHVIKRLQNVGINALLSRQHAPQSYPMFFIMTDADYAALPRVNGKVHLFVTETVQSLDKPPVTGTATIYDGYTTFNCDISNQREQSNDAMNAQLDRFLSYWYKANANKPTPSPKMQ